MAKAFVHIFTNRHSTVLYTGVTSNLVLRIQQHKRRQIEGFTKKYNCDKLVWFVEMDNIELAIAQEKRIKKWKLSL